MNTRWFHKHADHVLGPYNRDEMHLLAALGLMLPDDLLWPEGGDEHVGQDARAAIDFASLPTPRISTPDWLADVERAERLGPQPIEWPSLGTPGWLEEMRQDQRVGGSRLMAPLPVDAAVPADQAACPPPRVESPSKRVEAGDARPSGPTSATPRPDLACSPSAPTAHGSRQAESSHDLYQRARAAIHAWADLEANKPLILAGDCDAVREDAAVQVILRLAEQCGPHFANRFWKHLEFVVHTRRKYYLAAT
jgi:hypothetical protein